MALIPTCVALASCQTGGTAKSDAEERGAARVGPRVLVAHSSRDAPQGFQETLTVPDSHDPTCAQSPQGLDIYSEPRAETGTRTRLCLFGFEPSGPIELTTISPAGSTSTRRDSLASSPDNAGIPYYWDVPVEGPTGKWSVHVTRGESTATDEIEVGAATYPHVAVEGSSPFDPVPDVAAGEPVPIAMSGFGVDSLISIHVYQQEPGDEDTFRWVNALRMSPAETRSGHVSVPTGTGDPAGSYCFVYHGTPFGDDAVCGSTLFELT